VKDLPISKRVRTWGDAAEVKDKGCSVRSPMTMESAGIGEAERD